MGKPLTIRESGTLLSKKNLSEHAMPAQGVPVPGIGTRSADSDSRNAGRRPAAYFASWKMMPNV
jgi:hypothetical protein